MANKFERNYRAVIQVDEDDRPNNIVEIGLPFTVQFDITRNTLSSSNVAQFRFYNLKQEIRDRIRKNLYDFDVFRAVSFEMGYGDDLAAVFIGTVSQAWSHREGTNVITQLECFDGGFAFVNGITNRSFAAGAKRREVILELFQDLPRVKPGKVTAENDTESVRATVYSGPTKEVLDDISAGGFFVDNGAAHVLNLDEYIDAPVTVISPDSGLLGTPVLENDIAHFDLIMEPNLTTCQAVRIEGFVERQFNGLRKIVGVKHRGLISGAVAGEVVTTGKFFYSKDLKKV